MLGIELDARAYLTRLAHEVARLDERAMDLWGRLVYRAWLDDRCVFVFGNGGSATTATHICEDFGKSSLREDELFHSDVKRLRIMSLTDNLGWITALGNDLGYGHVFSQQLMSFARPKDLVIAISGSGNSPNVITAVEWANARGLVSFALTGYDGGKLRRLAHYGLHVPLDDMGMVESIHLAAFHWVLNDVHARIHREGRYASKAGSLDGPPGLDEALDAVPSGLMPA